MRSIESLVHNKYSVGDIVKVIQENDCYQGFDRKYYYGPHLNKIYEINKIWTGPYNYGRYKIITEEGHIVWFREEDLELVFNA